MHSARNRVIDTGITLAASAAVLLLALSAFIMNGESLIWSSDGLMQHYPALYFFNDWIRGVLQHPGQAFPCGRGVSDSARTSSGRCRSTWSGTPSRSSPSRFRSRSWRSPIKSRSSSESSVPPRSPRSTSGMGAKNVPALIGALIYTFSGFMLCNGLRHPMFVTAMVFLPLLLLGAEHALRSRRPWLLTAVVFLSAVGNFYFFYILTIITVLYTVARYFETTERELRWRQLLPYGLRIAGFYTLGSCWRPRCCCPRLPPSVIRSRANLVFLRAAVFASRLSGTSWPTSPRSGRSRPLRSWDSSSSASPWCRSCTCGRAVARSSSSSPPTLHS